MYYDEIAAGYDKLYEEEQLKKLQVISQYLKPRGCLLDVGAGSGVASRFFAGQCQVIAVDPSFHLVKQFAGLKVVARAEVLPFRSKTFDIVLSVTALHHADFKKSLKEIKRVAKSDAQIIISFLKKGKNVPDRLRGFKKVDNGKDWLFIRKFPLLFP
ncbi:MAG: class I SAM-dependent methyltransferase [Nanoarchaeota archaeon]|nr:class I SAM-dependent methyltransferase [Nanoarchaeota archaeon]